MRVTHCNRRQLVRVMVIAMCLGLSALPMHAAGTARLRATLLRSTSAANSHSSMTPGSAIAPPSPMAMKDEPSAVAVSLLRGLGLGAMMSGIGLLFFGAAAGSRRNLDPEKLVVRLITIGSLLLVAHMVAWLYHISPTNGVSGEVLAKAVDSRIGRIEAIRVMLALLTLWALALAGRKSLALFFGVACLLISGAVGHSAGIDPQWAVPAKMVHLLSGSVWLGGFLWLLWTFRRDVTAFRIEARRVSGAALIAIIGVFASGVAQTYLFLNSPWDLVHSSYGRLVLAKMAGLLLLVAYGAQNRFRMIPRLDDARVGKRLSRSVAQEITIMTIVILIGGFLVYLPTPPMPVSPTASLTAISR